MIDAGRVAAAVDRVRDRIVEAGGDVDRIRLVAVTKGFGVEAVEAALAAGVGDIGESYAQELRDKAAGDVLAERADVDLRWHFVGRLQSNKVRLVADRVHLWHSIDRPSLVGELARRAPHARVLVQVDVTGEPQKGGCPPAEVAALVHRLRARGIDVRGLMAVGPVGPPEAARPGFRQLAALAAELELEELSMGMTDDLEVAVSEGATIVRVGRALFGERPVRRPGR